MGTPYLAALEKANKAITAKYQNSEILPELSSRPDYSRASIITSRILSGFEYSKQPLNDEMAGRIFDAYFDALDPQRMYLLKDDISKFRPMRLKTAEMIAHGD